MTQSHAKQLLQQIPPAAEVRERLAQSIRETKVLRQILRFAERLERDRQHGGAVRP